jgi:hypothetical protein
MVSDSATPISKKRPSEGNKDSKASASPASKKRPSEVNKYVTSIIFAVILAVAGFLFPHFLSTRAYISGAIILLSFVVSFFFNSIFQLLQKCPFNPVSAAVSSGVIASVILLTSVLLYIPFVGTFLVGIVDSAFPYIPDPEKMVDKTVGDPLNPMLSDMDKHMYSHAYAYWMFWSGLLPMYTFLGFIGSC